MRKTMKSRRRSAGFALVLVMLMLAMAVILGLSYLSVASMKVAGSDNYVASSKARYLAESGLEHALYLIQTNPTAVGSAAAPLGPFFIDTGSDHYTLYSEPTGVPHQFRVIARGTSGDITQQSEAIVSRSPNPLIKIPKTIMLNVGNALLNTSVRLTGDVHNRGDISNTAFITGSASATGTITDTFRRITDGLKPGIADIPQPALRFEDYQTTYWLGGTQYTTATVLGASISSLTPVNNGAAVTPANPGGVVRMPGSLGKVRISNNVNFTGTLITSCDIYIDGSNVTLTAVDGFPAIVTKGWIYISDTARVTINGSILSEHGIRPNLASPNSRTTINGCVVMKEGFDMSLGGLHTINNRLSRTQLYDIRPNPVGDYKVEIENWVR